MEFDSTIHTPAFIHSPLVQQLPCPCCDYVFTSQGLPQRLHSCQSLHIVITCLPTHASTSIPCLPMAIWIGFPIRRLKGFQLKFFMVASIFTHPHHLTQGSTTSFRTPLEKLAEDPFDTVAWHFFLLFCQWCLIWPP